MHTTYHEKDYLNLKMQIKTEVEFQQCSPRDNISDPQLNQKF